MKARMRPLGGVGPIAIVICVAACGGSAKSGETDDGGGSGGSASGSGAAPDDGGNTDSGEGGVASGAPAGGRANTGGESTAGAQNRGGAGGTPMSPAGGNPGEGGADDLPMPGGGANSAGAGGEEAVSPPDGCSLLSQFSETGFCELGVQCDDGEFLQTHCIEMKLGVWQCGCQRGSASSSYNLGGVQDLAACRAMAELCRADTEPNPVGPVECGPTLEISSGFPCQVRRACTQEIQGHPDVTWAVLEETFCDDDGTGRLTCSCSNSDWSYYLEDPDATAACGLLAEFCEAPVEPTFDLAEWECLPQLETSGTGGCETQSSCTLTATVADGITVPVNSWVHVRCQDEASGSTCNCNGAAGEFRLDSDEPVDGITSCSSLSTFCVGLGDVEFSGDSSCTNVSLTTQEHSCEAQLRCAASATVSGRQVTTFRPVSVSCTETAGSWSCACNSDTASTTLSAEGSDAWDVCTNASTACADAVVPP